MSASSLSNSTAASGFAQFRLADARGAEKHERAVRPVGIRQARPGTAHRIGDHRDRLVLRHHALVQRVLEVKELLLLSFEEFGDRDSGPLGNHLADLFFRHAVAQQLVILGLRCVGQPALQIRDAPVLQLRHAGEIAGTAGCLESGPRRLEFLLDTLRAFQACLFRRPDLVEIGVLLLQAGDALLQVFEAPTAGFVAFLLQGLHFHLLLDEAALQAVHGLRLRIDFHAYAAGGLVDQVDGLVRKLPVGDVPVRQARGGDDGRVGDVHGVVQFVALLQTTQDGDGVLYRRFVDQHLLEAPLEGCVLLDVLTVFVQGGGPHAVQFAAGEGRFEHVAGIHGPFGLTRSDHGVQLVDEQDDVAFLLGEFVQHGLQPFLELAPELGSGDQRAHVERQDALVLEPLGHLPVEDALGQALDDGRLADAGLADQHRIVLGAALQHLDGPPDFVIAPDNRVELALLGTFRQVDGVPGECLPVVFGVGIVDGFPAPGSLDGPVELRRIHPGIVENPLHRAVPGQRPEHLLAGQVSIARLLGQAVGQGQGPGEFPGRADVAGGRTYGGHPVERRGDTVGDPCALAAGLDQERQQRTGSRFNQHVEQVHGFQGGVIPARRQRPGVRQGALQPACHSLHAHCKTSSFLVDRRTARAVRTVAASTDQATVETLKHKLNNVSFCRLFNDRRPGRHRGALPLLLDQRHAGTPLIHQYARKTGVPGAGFQSGPGFARMPGQGTVPTGDPDIGSRLPVALHHRLGEGARSGCRDRPSPPTMRGDSDFHKSGRMDDVLLP